MSGERESNPISGVLDWIKDTIDRVKALLIALGALIAAAVPIWEFVIKDPAPPPPSPTSAAGCYKLKVSPHDETVSFSRAKKSDMSWFDLDVKNDCQYDLLVDVEFEPLKGSITIAPPWPGYTAPAGQKIMEKVRIPNLILLNEAPQEILIRVWIYKTGTRELLMTHTYPITMVVG